MKCNYSEAIDKKLGVTLYPDDRYFSIIFLLFCLCYYYFYYISKEPTERSALLLYEVIEWFFLFYILSFKLYFYCAL